MKIHTKVKKQIESVLEKTKVTPDHEDNKHFYRIEQDMKNPVRFHSVTAVTGILDKKHLKKWTVKLAVDYIKENITENIDIFNLHEIVSKSQFIHVEKLKEAALIGNLVHEQLENYLNSIIDGKKNAKLLEVSREPQVVCATRAGKKFLDEYNVEPIASELLVASHKLGLAGTLDLLAMVNGKLAIVDWKTSNYINNSEYLLQVSGYEELLREMFGIKVKEVYVVQLNKNELKYTAVKVGKQARKEALRRFKKMVDIYYWLEGKDSRLKNAPKKLKL